MSRYTLDYDPGTEPGAYSNYGYVLLSYLVEHVTGMAYYDYLSSAKDDCYGSAALAASATTLVELTENLGTLNTLSRGWKDLRLY